MSKYFCRASSDLGFYFWLVIFPSSLLSCVFGKTINYNEDENKLNLISISTTTENEIYSSRENVYSFILK
ncbi:hypothetical protein BCR32DRAFT_282098 [Anaeromyces robustus]|uniref:Lipoprotein n=1 Tax=Anaeromyces robustus TaxID=1754192 RepID=A0A1Y1WYI1_9FUNG|nr:hypothetical protein BCR32DRAFT_282098 [Anaeromyces robustus]|eukprot:ORX78639.1 hypothetical protein BCR32DRAFT_282098 [Anaeromyces robustus]